MTTHRIPLLVIAGPTAVGKTAHTVALARTHNLEILSADSMQVYRYLDVGTAKPAPGELQGVPYHLIDFVDPGEQFNVAQFVSLADRVIKEIRSQGKVPLVVGGTGMYIKSLLYGVFDESGNDAEIRSELIERVAAEGLGSLYNELRRKDPEAASHIQPGDRLRIIRALEVYYATGKPISELQRKSREQGARYSYRLVILDRNRDDLYKRINQRVDTMIQTGFVEEVRSLLEKGYTRDSPGLKALGYRQIIDYLKGGIHISEATESIKKDTRNYAKRQLTWFRGMNDAQWMVLTGKDDSRILSDLSKDLIATFDKMDI